MCRPLWIRSHSCRGLRTEQIGSYDYGLRTTGGRITRKGYAMRELLVYALVAGLFYFSEGKPCPEKTRPHKTRCDAFYKCRELPSNSHVWIPVKCNEGLVFESSLGSCVLPGEDWECITPSEMSSTQSPGRPDADILIVNDMDEAGLLLSESSHKDDGTVEIVLDSKLSSEENDDNEEAAKNKPPPNEDMDISSSHNFDSSGDGELVELDSPAGLKPENREEVASSSMEHQTEVEKLRTELKQVAGISEIAKPGSPIDPSLTAHLQRLSQLIDGLQQTYQKTDKPQTEMRPDQLNAFLAHFDIKNRYEMMNPMEQTSSTITTTSSTTEAPKATPRLPQPTSNKTRLQEHLSRHRLEPETKLMLSNAVPYSAHGTTGQGYANSQIVVNRPEGSVMFALPPNYGMSQEQGSYVNHHPAQSHEYSDHEPKISEDTLKTVLELSKQMIAAQNLPKVLPNPSFNGAYYQPILQPVFMSPQGNPFQQYYGMPPPLNPHYMQHTKHSSGGSSSNNGYNKPSTTIIHNNVIPVHLSSTSSGEKEVLDTYGNSLGIYPSMDKHVTASQASGMEYMTTARPVTIATTASTYSAQYGSQSPFASDYTLTTPRPFEQQPSAATVATYYTPSPHLGEHNANRVYQPTESYPTMNMPRPMDMFPGQIDADRVSIRPNSQKIESMEMDEDMIKATYQSGSGIGNGNGNGNTLPHVLTYSSDMSQQLAPSNGYLEQSYSHQQPQHHHHPYMPRPRPRPTMSSSIYSDSDGNMEMSMFTSSPNLNPFKGGSVKYPGSTSPNGQLVNFNGNFISLDVFQKSILPLMTKSPSALNELGNVEVITCQAGVRQPNQTDCTRYFVCSKKDGKVLSYSCPPYTAFNKQTRICDAPTYAQCSNVIPAFNGYTIDSNRRLQMDAIKMLSEAKRRQEAALKAQSIANLLQQYGSTQQAQPGISSNVESDPLDSYVVSLPEVSLATTTTSRPTIIQSSSNVSSGGSSTPAKKRKYYCKEGDKIPDQTSISSYFVCYKNAQGQMKGHKMSCSKSLLFCPKTLMCTLASKCTD
ncbi:uncharacterized protein Dyak_GE15249 [Drosophila yakuba]|uniref:Chitin-binding type-2 domain-containing protein n=2 Tax=Drosophila yakuba TaxID=7245 RepID=B4NW38_DROYA|nr:uncharacterized protein Dyak_GE15249 [Drosophila yakuba]